MLFDVFNDRLVRKPNFELRCYHFASSLASPGPRQETGRWGCSLRTAMPVFEGRRNRNGHTLHPSIMRSAVQNVRRDAVRHPTGLPPPPEESGEAREAVGDVGRTEDR